MQDKRREILLRIIGVNNYSDLMSSDGFSSEINKWLAEESANTDQEAKNLLKTLLINALAKSDEFVKILIEIHKSHRFVMYNDLMVLNAAIITKKSWLVFQILSLGISPAPFLPLFIAYSLESESLSIIQLLLEHGFNPDLKGYEGKTLIEQAKEDGKQDVVELVSSFKAHGSNAAEIRKKKLQELVDYTAEYCLIPIDENFLSKLRGHIEYNKNLIDYWLLGKDKRTAEELLSALLQHAKNIRNLPTQVDLGVQLIKKPIGKTVEELNKLAGKRAKEYINYLGEDSELKWEDFCSKPDYAILYTSWLNGVDYNGMRSGDPNYTCVNWLNDMLELAVENYDLRFFNLLITLNQRKDFINNARVKVMELAIGMPEFAIPLLNLNFNPNGPERFPYLYQAFENNHPEIVMLLLDKGVDPYKKSRYSDNQSFMKYARERVKIRPDLNIEEILSQYEQTHPAPEEDKPEVMSEEKSVEHSPEHSEKDSVKRTKPTPVHFLPSPQWTAFGSKPVVSKNDQRKFNDQLILGDYKHKIASLPAGVQHALDNMCLYGAKLMSLQGAVGDEVLTTKINSLSALIQAVLSKEKLTEESLQDDYNAFERNDVNRQSGCYRIHTFFKWKRYEDEDGKSRFVKSTVGELAYDLMQAVKKLPVADVLEDQDQSQIVSSVGG